MDSPPTTSLVDVAPPTVAILRRLAFVAAAFGIAGWIVGRRLGWFEYRPGGAAFDNYVSPVAIGMFVAATIVALRSEIAAAALGAFAAAALGVFATEQLVATHAAIVVTVLAVPAVLWLIVALSTLSRRTSLVAIGLVPVTAVVGVAVGAAVYDHFWGPTHPSTQLAELPDSPVEWVWAGAVTADGGEIRAHPRTDYDTVRLAVSTDSGFGDPTWVEPTDASGRVVGFRVTDLDPDTSYHYAVEIDGELDTIRAGEFTTFPRGAASFTVAVGACARNGSNGAVFDAIRGVDPLLYLITGDLHYSDNIANDVELYREVLDLTLSRPAQSALYRTTPVAYVWDDHDYGPNDADGNSPSRQAAMAAYREHVPSYELAGADSPVYQAFTVGRVRFVLTDARSGRNLDSDEEQGATSMLGAEQKAWFEQEIVVAAETHELVVWVNPVPWIAEAREGADHWGGFADERREIADHIAANDITNLLMVSGDAHMVAIDDGTNTDYSTAGHPGFPLLHSAALDRPGGIKGGPYSHGAEPGGGQFATLDIDDDGDHITVELTGRTWDGDVLMSYRFTTADTPEELTE